MCAIGVCLNMSAISDEVRMEVREMLVAKLRACAREHRHSCRGTAARVIAGHHTSSFHSLGRCIRMPPFQVAAGTHQSARCLECVCLKYNIHFFSVFRGKMPTYRIQ